MAWFFSILPRNRIIHQTLKTMKKALLFLSIFALILASCTSRTADNKTVQLPTVDTTGLAAFQEWKYMHERAAISEYKAETQPEQYVSAPRKKAPVKKVPKKPAPVNEDVLPTSPLPVDNGTGDNTESIGSETSNEAQTAKKKGISKAAKGTAIGAVSGGVLGAVIFKKNRVLGGAIGAVLGGGIGYGIGRKMDKNDGR
jgi:hypothetical protein